MGKFVIPKDIEKDALVYMKYVVDTLEENGIIQDNAALTMLARNYSTFIKAQKQVEKEGLTVTSDRGNISEHPAVKIARDAQNSALKVMAEFGLTAKARSKLKIEKSEEDSPFEQFLKEGKELR